LETAFNDSASCHHEAFESAVKVNRLLDSAGTVIGYSADIQIRCSQCNQPFYWIAPIGASPGEPMMSADGIELRAPLTPVKGMVHATERMGITQHVGVEIVRAPRQNTGETIDNSEANSG
jgi:hypothetical protein